MIDGGGLPLLLERESVLAELDGHLAASVGGQGRLVLLHGEAGVGKTSVLERFTETVTGSAEVLRGWCDPLSTPRPLGPWADLAPGLGAAVDAELESGSGAVWGLLRAVLTALATRPRVLLLEDLHWADEATLDMVRLLVHRIVRLPTLLLATYRDDEIGSRHPMRVLLGDVAASPVVHRYSIEPLSGAAVAELVGARAVDVGQLYQVTGGNPFFVTEVLGSDGESIPLTVGDAVAARMSRLSGSAHRAAQVVALIGPEASVSMLEELVPGAPLDELVESGLLVSSAGGLAFRHELARMAVSETIPGHARSEMHAEVLALLRGPAGPDGEPRHGVDAALLAHHAEAAGDTTGVLEYAPRAAERAAASGAHREAAAQYDRTLRFGARMPAAERAALLERFARSCHMAGQLTEALDALDRAAELWRNEGDALREGAALRLLSGLSVPAGRLPEARRIGERALRVLEARPPSVILASACVNMAELSAYSQLGVQACAFFARRAEGLGHEFGDRQIVLQARFVLSLSRYLCEAEPAATSAWDEMEGYCEDALAAGLVEAAALMTMLQVTTAPLHRSHAGTDLAFARLEGLAHERDLHLYLRTAAAQRTLSLLHRGSWEEAAEQATSLVNQAGAPVERIGLLLVQGLVRARRGDPDVAKPLDEALRLIEGAVFPAVLCAARAEAAWLAGDVLSALREVNRGLSFLTPHTDPWQAGELGRWAALVGGRLAQTRVAEPFALEIAGEWRAAAAIWERMECPYDAALARLAGDAAEVEAALQTFETLGARPAADRARMRLRTLGVRPGQRGPRRSTRANPHGLTTRQREILDLVAGGLTDNQIAARLHLSAKTVNHHVGAVLAKLEVHTRADAVRKVAGSG